MAGRLYETDYMLTNEETRSGIASFDVDGGAPLTLGAVVSTDKACKTIGKYATGNKTVYIAYNPSFSYVLEDGQKVNPQLEGGVYTNIAGTTVSAFRPRTGVEFAVIMDNIDGSTEPTVGKFLEPKNGTLVYSIASTQTADTPSFEVVDIQTVRKPTGDVGGTKIKKFIVKTVYNV